MFQAYCINLKRRTDRWEYMQNVSRSGGFRLKRVDALDASLHSSTEEISQIKKRGPTGVLGQAALACVVSHARAWQEFLSSGESYGVILEDDVIISDDFSKTIIHLIDRWPELDLIKLECGGSALSGLLLGRQLSTYRGRNLRECFQVSTDAAGYILSRSGAETALRNLRDCDVGVDHYLFYPIPRKGCAGIRFGMVEPAILIQDRNLKSDITNARYEDRTATRRIKRVFYEVSPAPYMMRKLLSGARFMKTPFQNAVGDAI